MRPDLPSSLLPRFASAFAAVPWRRRARTAALVGSGALLLLAGAAVVRYRYAYTLPPEPSGLSAPSTLSAEATPLPRPNGQPNGYDTLAAAERLRVEEVAGVRSSPRGSQDPWPLAGRRRLLDANAAALRGVRRALGQEFLVPPLGMPGVTKAGVAADLAPHASPREFARLLACQAATDAERGELDAAAGAATDAVELGVVLPRGGGMLDALTGSGCEAIGTRALWRLADRLDAPAARGTALRLERVESRRWPLARTLRHEAREYRRGAALLFAGGPVTAWRNVGATLGQGAAAAQGVMDLIGLPPEKEEKEPSPGERLAAWADATRARARLVYDGPRTVVEGSDRFFGELADRADKPWAAWIGPGAGPPLPDDLLNRIALPAYPGLAYRDRRQRAEAALARTYLAVRAYRLERGAYPKSLADVVAAGCLTDLPRDPFSPAGAPLGYRRIERTDGDRFALWSVGPDSRDDGGRPVAAPNAPNAPPQPPQSSQRGSKGWRPVEVRADAQGDIVARVNTW